MGARPSQEQAKEPDPRPVVLMVSGGSDSVAMLEMAAAGELPGGYAARPLHVLHVNHMLRGADADADEAFVVRRCEELGVPCEVARVDVAALARSGRGGVEAVAREQRYQRAESLLDALCADAGVEPQHGTILTAHTLDDRIETFCMRFLVGTGPGGLASIPRLRGRIARPLLDETREQLRDWLRARHPGTPDARLWREDATNEDGSNFRSRVRCELVPVLRALRPNFARPLAQTMDLIAEEDAAQRELAQSACLRNLSWDGTTAVLPTAVLAENPRPLARRILRQVLLVVDPAARIESAQIERVLEHLDEPGYATEASGGVRVRVATREITVASVAH